MTVYVGREPAEVALLLRVVPPRSRVWSTYIPESTFPRRVSGRHLVVDFIAVDDEGDMIFDPVTQEFATRRTRVKIPKGHPWRGRKAGRVARRGR